jgi:glutamine amidotransferase
MIAVVDYGVGNLRSAQKALEHVACGRGLEVMVTSDPGAIAAAKAVVLPGQGAFGTCMRNLRAAGLVEPVRAAVDSGRPFLGICIGMQLLFEGSDESPDVQGLGVFGGRCVRFPRDPVRKVPHMGWDQVRVVGGTPVLAGIEDGSYVYFVHSYYAVPSERSIVATETAYGPTFASSVARDNVFAGVFHPEKSQRVGLHLLRNFVGQLA